jgi:hypothetical protein
MIEKANVNLAPMGTTTLPKAGSLDSGSSSENWQGRPLLKLKIPPCFKTRQDFSCIILNYFLL